MKKYLIFIFVFISSFVYSQNSKVPQSTDFINVKTSGGDATGTADISTLINTLQAIRKPLYFPSGSYKIKNLKLLDSVAIIGDDGYTYFKTATNDTILSCGNYNYISGITFIGNSGTRAQTAINMDSVIGNRVISCHFQTMGVAIRTARAGLMAGYQGHQGNQVEFCDGQSNVWGVRCETRAEYNTFNHVKFQATTNAAFYNAGGNNTFVACDGNTGGIGYELAGGLGNDAHSNVTGCHFNHNTRSLYVHGVVFGYTFSSTQFYYGRMQLDTSVNILFQGCDIDCTGDSLVINKLTQSSFVNCKFFSTPLIGNYSTNSVLVFGTNELSKNSINIYDIFNNKNFQLANDNGIEYIGGSTLGADNGQQLFFYHPIVGTNGTYGSNRDLCVGPTDIRGTSSGATDLVQVYRTGTTGSTMAVLDNAANYLLRVMPTRQVVIGASTGSSTFSSGESESHAYRPITALRTLDVTDHIVNCTANSFTVTLPTAVGITGREYIIKNTGTATTITIATTSAQTIDGSAPGVITTLIPLRVVSDGANWITF